MAVHFSVPASPKRSILTIDEFLGADFTNSPASADINKSPNCVNMIRDVPGKVRKCMGYETVDDLSMPNLNGDFLKLFRKKWNIAHTAQMTNYCYDVDCYIRIYEYSLESSNLEFVFTGMAKYTATEKPLDITVSLSLSRSSWIEADEDAKTLLYNCYKTYGDSEVPAEDIQIYQQPINPWTFKFFKVEYPGYTEVPYSIGVEISFTDYIDLYDNTEVYFDDRAIDVSIYRQYESGTYFINGFHRLRSDEYGLIHVGTSLYRNGSLLYDGVNNARSKSWEFNEKLYIVDGKNFLCYGVTEPKSDTKFKESKETNEVVVDDEVKLIIYRYAKKQDTILFTEKTTTSTNGKFAIGKDKRTITYTDKLTTVGQEISYSCSWKAKKSSSASYVSKSITTHKLKAISDEGEYEVNPVSDDAYVPIFDISRDPDGTHSEFHEDLNLLTPWFEEDFLGQANVTDYHLTFDNLDEVEPIVEVMDQNGEFQEKIYGSEYTVNYETGVVTFASPPGESPSEGHDNVKIRACKTFEGYQDRINKCTVGALYGVNGSLDSLFLSGNPDYLNYDWHSKANEPTYFKDTAYATLGSSSSAIIGYSIINNYLAAHKDRYERDQNIILREGDLVDNQPAFRIINTLQGAGAVAPFSFAYLATEPLFLTEQGIYAVTAQDITGEKYAQDRSFFLNGRLLQEENLKDAYAITYNDMYLLCINDVVYILDGLQPIRTDRAEPYATRQYAGFYRTNVPARVMWEDGGRLFFGTDDGKVCRFFNDKYSNESYNDNGEVIEANWETPDIIGKVFFKNKTLRHIAIKLDSSISTSVNIYVMNRGLYNFVKTEGRLRELWDLVAVDNTRARFLSFANLIFSRFTFSNDQTQHTLPTKVRVKKVDKFRLKLTNDQLNEPFGLFDIGFEYVENGNYKG